MALKKYPDCTLFKLLPWQPARFDWRSWKDNLFCRTTGLCSDFCLDFSKVRRSQLNMMPSNSNKSFSLKNQRQKTKQDGKSFQLVPIKIHKQKGLSQRWVQFLNQLPEKKLPERLRVERRFQASRYNSKRWFRELRELATRDAIVVFIISISAPTCVQDAKHAADVFLLP